MKIRDFIATSSLLVCFILHPFDSDSTLDTASVAKDTILKIVLFLNLIVRQSLFRTYAP